MFFRKPLHYIALQPEYCTLHSIETLGFVNGSELNRLSDSLLLKKNFVSFIYLMGMECCKSSEIFTAMIVKTVPSGLCHRLNFGQKSRFRNNKLLQSSGLNCAGLRKDLIT
jgi:hypothetical protein